MSSVSNNGFIDYNVIKKSETFFSNIPNYARTVDVRIQQIRESAKERDNFVNNIVLYKGHFFRKAEDKIENYVDLLYDLEEKHYNVLEVVKPTNIFSSESLIRMEKNLLKAIRSTGKNKIFIMKCKGVEDFIEHMCNRRACEVIYRNDRVILTVY